MASHTIELAQTDKCVWNAPNQNIYNMDLFLWMQLRAIALADSEKAYECFRIPQKTIELLMETKEAKLQRIASGVFCSMRLIADETALIRGLMGAERLLAESPSHVLSLQERMQRTSQDLIEDYLRYARDSVALEGEPIARLRFDLSRNILRALKGATDYQIRLVARTVACRFEMRFSHKCLEELLLREYTTHFKIIQYQEALSQIKTAFIPMRETEKEAAMQSAWESWRMRSSVCSGDTKTDQDSGARRGEPPVTPTLRGHAPQWRLATAMGKLGFTRMAISTEAGITSSQLSRLRKELAEQGVDISNISKRATSGRFIENYQASLHASIMMQVYSELTGPDKAYRIDIDALIAALSIYKQIRIESESNNAVRWPEITAVEGYVLAKEVRGDGIQPEAYMESCGCCDASYFVSIYQSISDKVRCPYCRINDAKRIKAA